MCIDKEDLMRTQNTLKPKQWWQHFPFSYINHYTWVEVPLWLSLLMWWWAFAMVAIAVGVVMSSWMSWLPIMISSIVIVFGWGTAACLLSRKAHTAWRLDRVRRLLNNDC